MRGICTYHVQVSESLSSRSIWTIIWQSYVNIYIWTFTWVDRGGYWIFSLYRYLNITLVEQAMYLYLVYVQIPLLSELNTFTEWMVRYLNIWNYPLLVINNLLHGSNDPETVLQCVKESQVVLYQLHSLDVQH